MWLFVFFSIFYTSKVSYKVHALIFQWKNSYVIRKFQWIRTFCNSPSNCAPVRPTSQNASNQFLVSWILFRANLFFSKSYHVNVILLNQFFFYKKLFHLGIAHFLVARETIEKMWSEVFGSCQGVCALCSASLRSGGDFRLMKPSLINRKDSDLTWL